MNNSLMNSFSPLNGLSTAGYNMLLASSLEQHAQNDNVQCSSHSPVYMIGQRILRPTIDFIGRSCHQLVALFENALSPFPGAEASLTSSKEGDLIDKGPIPERHVCEYGSHRFMSAIWTLEESKIIEDPIIRDGREGLQSLLSALRTHKHTQSMFRDQLLEELQWNCFLSKILAYGSVINDSWEDPKNSPYLPVKNRPLSLQIELIKFKNPRLIIDDNGTRKEIGGAHDRCVQSTVLSDSTHQKIGMIDGFFGDLYAPCHHTDDVSANRFQFLYHAEGYRFINAKISQLMADTNIEVDITRQRQQYAELKNELLALVQAVYKKQASWFVVSKEMKVGAYETNSRGLLGAWTITDIATNRTMFAFQIIDKVTFDVPDDEGDMPRRETVWVATLLAVGIVTFAICVFNKRRKANDSPVFKHLTDAEPVGSHPHAADRNIGRTGSGESENDVINADEEREEVSRQVFSATSATRGRSPARATPADASVPTHEVRPEERWISHDTNDDQNTELTLNFTQKTQLRNCLRHASHTTILQKIERLQGNRPLVVSHVELNELSKAVQRMIQTSAGSQTRGLQELLAALDPKQLEVDVDEESDHEGEPVHPSFQAHSSRLLIDTKRN